VRSWRREKRTLKESWGKLKEKECLGCCSGPLSPVDMGKGKNLCKGNRHAD